MKAYHWSLPLQKKALDIVKRSTLFTVLDLCSAYWQTEMAELCQKMTTITTCYETHQLEVVPFGVLNVASTFQPFADVLSQGLPLLRVYMVDVVVLSTSTEEHGSHIREVFRVLKFRCLNIKLSKFHFA